MIHLFNLWDLFQLKGRMLALNYTWKRNNTAPCSKIISNSMLCTLSIWYEMVIDIQIGVFMFSSEISVSNILSTTSNSIMDSDKKPCSSGHVLRNEPKSIEWMIKFPLTTAKLKEVGWYTLCEKIGGYEVFLSEF